MSSFKNKKIMNELNTRQWFIDFLKNNLNYLDSNLILEKRINNSIIDLVIVESDSIEFHPLAIVEFKASKNSIDNAELQVEKYMELIGKRKLPSFLSRRRGVCTTFFWMATYYYKRLS